MRKVVFTLSSTSSSSTTLGGITGTGDFSLTGLGFDAGTTVFGTDVGVGVGVGFGVGVGVGVGFGVEVEVDEDIVFTFVGTIQRMKLSLNRLRSGVCRVLL